ncbi:Cytosolic malate dehydrogenase [Fasciola gigantica]|uniref:Malate dehydrogenase n=2 Tax=Fasciola TaxID=6191 RepID=A0A2H1CF15_FASHE|nr:Cytosolic malate dehydrogenase [Fasciola hepatica]TPP57859.1 Cytosolic malate dehydrogenase [Fasciola gigantica]
MAPVKVLITGAAGQIGYNLAGMVARGDMLGPNQELILHLFDITPMLNSLHGLQMELDDCAFPLVREVVITDKAEVAFDDIDIALMVGAMPRKEGMERKDLLQANANIFKEQGKVLNEKAKKTVKVIVVGNPANTNALIMMKNAPSIPKENFSAMTRLDHNRATAQIAKRLKIPCTAVKNCVIWGNHSATQFPDVSHAVASIGGKDVKVWDAIKDEEWLKNEFVTTVQKRGAAVIAARKLSSAMSAAKAVVDHIHDWWYGTKPGEWVSMSVWSDGSYGAPVDVFFSFPVEIKDKKWTIVKDLSMDDWGKSMFKTTAEELSEEKVAALGK